MSKASEVRLGLLIVLLLALVLMVASALMHYEMLRGGAAVVKRVGARSRPRLVIVIICALAAHTLHIAVYALAFTALQGHPLVGMVEGDVSAGYADFFYFSMTNYTTLGIGDLSARGPMRLLAASESLTGLVLITWTASFAYLSMEDFWKED